MSFLATIAAKLLEWLLEKGGRYLYEQANKFVKEKKQAKIDKPNLEQTKEDIEKEDFDKAAEDMVRLANGNKKK